MKLRNKQTGEIVEKWPDDFVVNSGSQIYNYNSLAELCEEWEDYEDSETPSSYWMINDLTGEPMNNDCSKYFGLHNYEKSIEHRKKIGNYFETKKEAEKAAEKLKDWKRLKDKGFRFCGIDGDYIKYAIDVSKISSSKEKDELNEYARLIFGGEE